MSLVFLVIQSVNRLVDLYQFLLILYILSGWIPQLRQSTVGHILAQLSEPYLRLFRGIFPPLGGIDFISHPGVYCAAPGSRNLEPGAVGLVGAGLASPVGPRGATVSTEVQLTKNAVTADGLGENSQEETQHGHPSVELLGFGQALPADLGGGGLLEPLMVGVGWKREGS